MLKVDGSKGGSDGAPTEGEADAEAQVKTEVLSTRQVAQLLGINRNTLRKKLKEHGIDPDAV